MPLPKTYIKSPSIKFIVGPTGVFGYCGLSQAEPDKVLYFSFYDCDLPQRGLEMNQKAMEERLRERHRNWTDPLIGQCLEKASLDNIYPVFYVPDLPFWGRNGCILVGDAPHAMPPANGQGGNQAFEDGQALALLLAGYLERYDAAEAISRSIQGFYDVRHERVDAIKAKGLSMEEPERPWSLVTTLSMYTALLVMMWVKYIGSFFGNADPVLSWDGKEEVRKYLAEKS